MKLFLDRNKTFLPRIDVIFLLTRGLIFATIGWFALFGDYSRDDQLFFTVIPITFAAITALFYGSTRNLFDIKLAYLSAIICDLLFLPLLIAYSGGINSPFYLLFYVTVSVAAYILTRGYAFPIAGVLTVSYLAIVFSQITVGNLFSLSMKIGFLWIFFLVITYVSEYLRKSEVRLLRLFNTLNMRTSELEKSQAQLEMIYENTRILASLLEPDAVVREVMSIMGRTLGLTRYAVVFRSPGNKYYYRARSTDGHTSFNPIAMEVGPNDLIAKVSDMQEGVRIHDLTGREDYRTVDAHSRSAIIIPMISHGRAQGLLLAEAKEQNAFAEKDEQMLSIVARAAGLALENAELHKRTEELTIIDALTSTFNYRYFIQKLQEEKKRALRYRLPLSIIMVDIDWFKKLNDGYGHEVGNVVLRELSDIIKQCIRDVDIFARYGGEEFVVILPQTARHEAAQLGERIRQQVENTVIDAGKSGEIKITVSVGVSSYPENGKSEEELVSVADEALYRAKDLGKNHVCVE